MPTLADRFTSLRKRGFLGAFKRLAKVAYRRVLRARITPHPFDVQHGVDTGGLLFTKDLATGHEHDTQMTAYYGTQPSIFHAAMQHWLAEIARHGQQPADFTFVDIGCGKGRVLMLASEYPFAGIVGLEISPQLFSAAQQNLAHWQQNPRTCTHIEVCQQDVLAYTLPAGPVLLYMYHPFEGELFAAWARSLVPALATRTAPVYLLYMNPYYEYELQVIPAAQFLWSERLPFSLEEAAAKLLDDTDELVSLYRLTAA